MFLALQAINVEEMLATDFEIGHFIRERLVPRAVLFFTGEANDDEDEDDEDDDDDVSFLFVSSWWDARGVSFFDTSVGGMQGVYPFCDTSVGGMQGVYPFCDTSVGGMQGVYPFCDTSVGGMQGVYLFCDTSVGGMQGVYPFCDASVALPGSGVYGMANAVQGISCLSTLCLILEDDCIWHWQPMWSMSGEVCR